MTILGIQGAVKLVTPKVMKRTHNIAVKLGRIAHEMHRDSPRGGYKPNCVGGQRSKPGAAPASEHGTLLTILQKPPTSIENGYSVNVNYVDQEYGGVFLTCDTQEWKEAAPRPLGRLSVARLKSEL